MLSYLVVLGVFLDKILEDVVKDVPAHITLSKVIIYYFLFSFVFRFFMQNLPTMEIVPYLHLRIKRKTLAWYMVFKSLFSFFNFMPFFLFLPFAIKYMKLNRVALPHLFGLPPFYFLSLPFILNSFILNASLH